MEGASDYLATDAVSATVVADNEWHHVAFVIDADAADPDNNKVTIYVDHVFDAEVLFKDQSDQGTGIGEDLSNDHDLWIGDYITRSFDQFVGDIDALRIHAEALTVSQFLPFDAIPGDTNNDRVVDEFDAQTVASNWGEEAIYGALEGDFDGDGLVGPTDAAILAAHWHYGIEEANPVPEPSGLALLFGLALLSAALGMFVLRRAAGATLRAAPGP